MADVSAHTPIFSRGSTVLDYWLAHAEGLTIQPLGVRVEESGDGMRVIGTDAPLRGRIHAFADHRIAMSFGVLGALPGNRIQIDDPSCVDISYPGFWEDLQRAST